MAWRASDTLVQHDAQGSAAKRALDPEPRQPGCSAGFLAFLDGMSVPAS